MEQRAQLKAWSHRRTLGHQRIQRAQIVLAFLDGMTDLKVAAELGVSTSTVSKRRRRSAEGGISGLLDAPRSGGPRTIRNERVAKLVRMTLEATPRGATHWSMRSLAKKLGLSHSAVGRG